MGSRSRLCSLVGYGMLVTNPRLRINLVALLCTFSIFSINCTDCGHHTWDAYARLLRTSCKYRYFLALMSVISKVDRLINPSNLLALDFTLLTWWIHVNLGLIVIPRSTSASEKDNRSPARLYGETKGDVFLVIESTLHLDWLKWRWFSFDQHRRPWISSCKTKASEGFFMQRYSLVSSENSPTPVEDDT